jgi:hypothetical protein
MWTWLLRLIQKFEKVKATADFQTGWLRKSFKKKKEKQKEKEKRRRESSLPRTAALGLAAGWAVVPTKVEPSISI